MVQQHGKHVLEPQKSKRAAKIQIFGPFKAVFRAQNEQQGQQGNIAENGVIWVKKSTSDILIREVISEVRQAEKRVFSPFLFSLQRGYFDRILKHFPALKWLFQNKAIRLVL